MSLPEEGETEQREVFIRGKLVFIKNMIVTTVRRRGVGGCVWIEAQVEACHGRDSHKE